MLRNDVFSVGDAGKVDGPIPLLQLVKIRVKGFDLSIGELGACGSAVLDKELERTAMFHVEQLREPA